MQFALIGKLSAPPTEKAITKKPLYWLTQGLMYSISEQLHLKVVVYK